jgi:uncharacterized protein (TIGR03503 family)
MISQGKIVGSTRHGQIRSLPRGWAALFFTLIAAILILPAQAWAEPKSDVRVLIDVSGSMKQNDPKNLRAPALRLLVELLPAGTRAGVWTFGQYVAMPVPLGNVDNTWRDKARSEAGKIHSRGLFTNIEEAVRKSSVDWKTPDPHFRRHLILLTDGMVDVGKDPQQNTDSRRRLLQELLPSLEQADVTVHTIALSDKVDFDLLQAISSATHGAFEKVNSAEELQRIFLRLFEKSVGADSVPIENNSFQVDKNVSDITVLVFLAKDSPATKLLTPAGKTLTEKEHPAGVQWHHDEGYDLVTIKAPDAGAWGLQAKVDPDNRVLVVTNLRMQLDKLPNTLLLGDHFDVRARLLEDNKTVTNANLLDKTQFDVKLVDAQSKSQDFTLKDDGQAPDSLKGDGVYSLMLDKLDKPGNYELIVQAKSVTFQREIHHSLHLYDSPADITISQESPDKPFHVGVLPHPGLIRPESVSMQVRFPTEAPLTMAQVNEQEWAIEIPANQAKLKFILTLAATRYDGKPLKMDFEQMLALTEKPQSLAIKIATPVHDTVAKPAAEAAPDKAHDIAKDAKPDDNKMAAEQDAAVEKPRKGFDWKIVGGIVLGTNVVVFTAGYLLYRRLRKSRQKQVEKDAKDMQV